MTVTPRIDPARMLEEDLAQASPDLLRELLCGAELGDVHEVPAPRLARLEALQSAHWVSAVSGADIQGGRAGAQD